MDETQVERWRGYAPPKFAWTDANVAAFGGLVVLLLVSVRFVLNALNVWPWF